MRPGATAYGCHGAALDLIVAQAVSVARSSATSSAGSCGDAPCTRASSSDVLVVLGQATVTRASLDSDLGTVPLPHLRALADPRKDQEQGRAHIGEGRLELLSVSYRVCASSIYSVAGTTGAAVEAKQKK